MATYTACSVSDLTRLQTEGDPLHGFDIVSRDGGPIVSFAYPDESAAKAARELIVRAIAGARITRP